MLTEREQENNSSEILVSEIIDSSAITKYFTREPGWLEVERYIANADTLELALKETSNALWKKILKKEIKLDAVKKIVKAFTETLWILDQRLYLDRALEIATQYNVSVYDALFLACAEIEKGKLVSCDGRQLEVARELGINVIVV